jgi:NAD(P)-dependent dehydrogenase (short-subunit alcohol dehydrogenase family)
METKQVIVLIGAGSIGQAITRRVGAGKHVLLADLRQENADAAAKTAVAAAISGTKCCPRYHPGRGTVELAVPPTRPGERFSACLPVGEARQRLAGDGRSCSLG